MNTTIRRLYEAIKALPVAVHLLVVLTIVGTTIEPKFVSAENVINILYSSAILAPAVAGTQILLIIGKFDLSIGATATISGMALAITFVASGSLLVAFLVVLVLALAIGLFNGITTSYWSINPLVATLASMSIIRSISLALNDGRIATGLPSKLGVLVRSELFGLPSIILFLALGAGIVHGASRYCVTYRRMYAVGNNQSAALHQGISINHIFILGFVIASLCAAMTGVLQAARTQSASPLLFQSLAIESIAACLIGGSALNGGKGSIPGALAGIIMISASRNFILMVGVPLYWKDFVLGVILLLAYAKIPRTKTNKNP